jgi:hypothetical protein
MVMVLMCGAGGLAGGIGSDTQYKKKIRKWGLEKNIGRGRMLAMLRIQDSRAAIGKKTVFKVNGRAVGADKLERSRKRFARVDGGSGGGRVETEIGEFVFSCGFWFLVE